MISFTNTARLVAIVLTGCGAVGCEQVGASLSQRGLEHVATSADEAHNCRKVHAQTTQKGCKAAEKLVSRSSTN